MLSVGFSQPIARQGVGRGGGIQSQNVVAERVLIMQTMSPPKIISSRTKIRIVQQRFMTSCPQHRV
jgi:hypothetical protein